MLFLKEESLLTDGENTSMAIVPLKMLFWGKARFFLFETWKCMLQNNALQAELVSSGPFDKTARSKPFVNIMYLNLVNIIHHQPGQDLEPLNLPKHS